MKPAACEIKNARRVLNPEVGSSILLPATEIARVSANRRNPNYPKNEVGQDRLFQEGEFVAEITEHMELTLFKPAQIYCANGDTSKNWYVHYQYFDPKTQGLKVYKSRGKPLYKQGINIIEDVNERFSALLKLQDYYNEKLASGWGPIKLPDELKRHLPKPQLLVNALWDVLEYKETYLEPNTLGTYNQRTRTFISWLKLKRMLTISPAEFTPKNALDFLTYLSGERGVSGRTRNNYRTDLMAIFNYFPKIGYRIKENPFEVMDKVPERSEMHLLYNKSEYKRLSHYLRQNDPWLRLFTLFITFGLREEEIVNLKCGDIDEEEGFVRVWAKGEKTGTAKFQRIHSLYLEDIRAMELWKYPQNYYVFTIYNQPDLRKSTRDYWSKRFKKVKKALGFTKYHTMYGIRHTTAADLAENGANLNEIMTVTGHKTLAALQKYLDKYLGQLPRQDFSHRLTQVL